MPEDRSEEASFGEVSRERARQLEELRRELLDERHRIVEDIRGTESEVDELERPLHREVVTDAEEIARAERSIQLDDRVEASRAGRLHTIDRALEAMSVGRYGFCGTCGEPIQIERLRALPDTPLCVECARRAG